MNFRNLQLKKTYSSETDNILYDFFIPVLQESTEYKRLAGFFSSSSLAVAARGIIGLIRNKGKMQLIMAPKLTKEDLQVIKDELENPEKYIENKMLQEFQKIEDEFTHNHVRALGWMLANGILEIKIAIPYNENNNILSFEEVENRGLFHPKVGILQDKDDNIISFSGSMNESASAWMLNIEEFKVFRSWESTEEEYLRHDIFKFNKFWNNIAKTVKIISLPTAIKNKLIEIAPQNIDSLDLNKIYSNKQKKEIELFDHQKDAINAWLKNDMKGIFEMATGTGKTFAALGCLKKLIEKEEKFITIIACPYNHLIKQWLDDIKEFGLSCKCIIADSSVTNWKDKLADYCYDFKSGIEDKLIILTTHETFSSEDFIKIIRIPEEKLFLIVDEVHGIGAPLRKQGLVDDYLFRLGLSATPKRWFDEEGTKKIFDYFGNTVYEFSLRDAINSVNPKTEESYLVPYQYKPYFIELTEEEFQEYITQTEKIAKAYQKSLEEQEKEELFTLLCFRRQKIIINAANKYQAFEEILNDIGENIRHCLVYCSDKQIDQVKNILRLRNINYHSFTMKESTTPEEKYGGISEREFLLKHFSEGDYQVLVAIKCLDEGVDIPKAKIAVILASSGNPREYIQRRGRILRRYPGKNEAIIYDIFVLPPFDKMIPQAICEIENKIFEKELKRYKEFSFIAKNSLECLNKIYKIEGKLLTREKYL